MTIIRVPLSTKARLHAAVALYERSQGEWDMTAAIIAIGESLDIAPEMGEAYTFTIQKVANERLEASLDIG